MKLTNEIFLKKTHKIINCEIELNKKKKLFLEEWENKLNAYIVKQLESLGYFFYSTNEFILFKKNYLISVKNTTKEQHKYNIYIKLNKKRKYIYVGSYNNNLKISIKKNTFTFTIGIV